jgi:hypothetical protein
LPIVASVVKKQRIVGILLEALLRVLRGDRPCLAAVTGDARTAVAPERLALEQLLAILRTCVDAGVDVGVDACGRSFLTGKRNHHGADQDCGGGAQ